MVIFSTTEQSYKYKMSLSNTPLHICILMSTFNGAKFLTEQLISIEQQSYPYWRVVISDDGSTDNTLKIAQAFQLKWGNSKLEIRKGPQKGFCQNFLSMACDPTIRADLYAFCDQDDVWLPDKIQTAVNYFVKNNDALPRAYGSRTKIVDQNLKYLGLSPDFTLPLSFRNALVQSIAGGNTQIFNTPTKLLFELIGVQEVVSHDWWLYQIVKGVGGDFFYDKNPTLLYRQHLSSTVGANNSFKAKIERIIYVFNGRFKRWNDLNFKALSSISHILTHENREILALYGKFRGAKMKDRVRLLEVCGLYRQTWQGTISLWIATLTNRI